MVSKEIVCEPEWHVEYSGRGGAAGDSCLYSINIVIVFSSLGMNPPIIREILTRGSRAGKSLLFSHDGKVLLSCGGY